MKAKAANGKLFNIEIQITDEADYDKRGCITGLSCILNS
ncbi:MAG: Rpn family recombination-promoting nuclease/putative transposase [Candidatus Midichloria sp.]|nr:Rpn family recombination-promoting nuclease/putative transposase [Candidatus Midichloria sp.]